MAQTERFPNGRPLAAIQLMFEDVRKLQLSGIQPCADRRKPAQQQSEERLFHGQVMDFYKQRSHYNEENPNRLHSVSQRATEGRVLSEYYELPEIRFVFRSMLRICTRGNPIVGDQLSIFDDPHNRDHPSAEFTRTNFYRPLAPRGSVMPTALTHYDTGYIASVHERLSNAIATHSTSHTIHPATTFELVDLDQFRQP